MENNVYVIAEVDHVPETEYREYLNPMKTRRYGRLLKRALVTALKAIRISGIGQPDAIINGTALGCIENSEKLLAALSVEGESASMPTNFMQSTHNTIASLIGIYTHNHGYNCTYSHKNISFESGMLDAYMQIKLGKIKTALVCANDEITSEFNAKVQQTGLKSAIKDRSLAVVLSSEKTATAVKMIKDVRISHDRVNGDVAEIIYSRI
jgi:3-oxoacyl-(acyl-carrier-protein) synthase